MLAIAGPPAYASFPWYDFEELRPANDALWDALARAFRKRGVADVPVRLDRARRHGTDRTGECLFTQTCGYPLFTSARDHFTVLGSPWYDATGCERGEHRSFIVVRAGCALRTLEDLRGTHFAVNEADSNSGMNLPRRVFAPLARDGRFFGEISVSGGHARSAQWIVAGRVDCAAVDCVSLALLARYRPDVARELRIVARTAATPTPPFVTTRLSDAPIVRALRAGIIDVLNDPALTSLREAVLLRGMTICGREAYEVVMRLEREAIALGYPRLA